MESTSLCTLISSLCLLTWEKGPASFVVIRHPSCTIDHRNAEVVHFHFKASSSITALQNVTQPTAVSFAIIIEQYYNNTIECMNRFYISMTNITPEHFCDLQHVISYYSKLQVCIEREADSRSIAYPNELSHSVFLAVHRDFFANCTLLSYEFADPPDPVLLALIFAPICIIPFLVTLVVVKSNTNKPQT